ncbi:MAG: HAD family hydrolase [Chloroflexi bacterium]|nr:HAD family hydrolase [Chloroflexota bacterium]
MNRAIFIDKDGTLIVDVPYNVDPELITLSLGAGEALRRFKDAGYLLVVVSNQSGVAKGMFDEAALQPVRQRLNKLLAEYGVQLDGFYYCPHWPHGTVERYAIACECRKPKAGMLLAAARDLNIDLSRSWMIGDILADTEAGKRADCRTVLIEKPYDPVIHLTDQNRPDFIVRSWHEATRVILARRAAQSRPFMSSTAG